MKVRISSEKEFILDNLVEAITTRKGRKDADYGDTIRFGVAELIRIYMREIAREEMREYYYHQEDLLMEAIEWAEQAIQERLAPYEIEFDINQSSSLAKELVYPAKELVELGEKLSQSKRVDRIGTRQQLASGSDIPFEITEIGLKDSIEGLLLRPLIDTCDLDLEKVQPGYTVEGKWFPFQVSSEEFTFVIDDDGTIFISTENFPPRFFDQAREMLWGLARRVYSQE